MTHPVRGGRLHTGRVPRDVAIFYTPQQTVVEVEVATSRKRCVCHWQINKNSLGCCHEARGSGKGHDDLDQAAARRYKESDVATCTNPI